MRLLPFLTVPVAVAAVLIASGCAPDNPSAPQALAAPSAALQSKSHGPVHATPLFRSAPLHPGLSTSATIGVLGGTLSLPDAGLTVIVPPFAVTAPTRFTITARPGLPVAYDFEPAGTHFTVPLVATQDLSNTQAKHGGQVNAADVSVGYYPDASQTTTVTELLGVDLNVARQSSTVSIWHFSGYIFMTRSEE